MTGKSRRNLPYGERGIKEGNEQRSVRKGPDTVPGLGHDPRTPALVWVASEQRNKHWGRPIAPRQEFAQDGGWTTEYAGRTAYLAPGASRAYSVVGGIRAAYARLNGPQGLLGYPTSEEKGADDGIGRYNTFEHGVIYWHPDHGGFEMHGHILERWRDVGAEAFGYPVTDEQGTKDGFGRFNEFRRYGPRGERWDASIYFAPWTGAWSLQGAIRERWIALGREESWLGYPKSDEYGSGSTRSSDFEKGRLEWAATSGVRDVRVSGGLQFRLRGFHEHKATDAFLQGASDEVYVSALGVDPSRIAATPDGQVHTLLWRAPPIGDISRDDVRSSLGTNPRVMADFDLHAAGDWPREYAVTLFIIEHDSKDLARAFRVVEGLVGDAVKAEVKKQAQVLGAAAAGAVIGSVAPGLGTLIGAMVGAAVGAAYEPAVEEIQTGLDNEVFRPQVLTLRLESPAAAARSETVGIKLSVDVTEHGAHYTVFYDWHLSD